VTDETRRAAPIAGWYPDPEDNRYLRWWNGYQWELRRPVPTQGEGRSWNQKPVGGKFARLANVIGVLLGLTLVVFVAELGLAAWGLSMVDDAVATGDLGKLDTYDAIHMTTAVLVGCGVLLTGVCWMVWQHKLARSARPGALRRGPRMHAFSWIIPVVSLWFPFQNVKDLWKVNAPAMPPTILAWWWTGWIAANVLDRIAGASYDGADSLSDVKGLMVLEGVTAGVGIVTALLATRIMRTLTAAALDNVALSAQAARDA